MDDPWHEIQLPEVTGVRVEGDLYALPSKANRFYMTIVRALWTKKAVLQLVDPDDARQGYRVGFRDVWGTMHVREIVQFEPGFKMRIGLEPVTFFALNGENKEVPLKVIATGRRRLPHPEFPTF